MLVPIAIATGAAASTAIGLRMWYRSFNWTTAEDERHVARTSDNWNLGLYRYKPKVSAKPIPVICSHGMAGTRLIYDLHSDYSLARFLAAAGFDTWLLDLRGRQNSWPDGGADRALQWSFDDFVQKDFPAAIHRVCELTGSDEVFWIGMEMSGQVLYAAAIDGLAGNIRGAITCGSPVCTPATAMVPGVTSAPRSRRKGRVPFHGGASLAGPVLAYMRAGVLESSFRARNVEPSVVSRYFRNGIPDEATDLVDQFKYWIDAKTMQSRDGTRVYSDRLTEVDLPLLVMVAEHDLQRPADAVEAAFDAFGSRDKTFVRAGIENGFSVDYGHDDLLAGTASPLEIFPRVRQWLTERS